MWNLLGVIGVPQYLRDGVTAPAVNVATLAKQYNTAQVTAKVIKNYYDNQLATTGAPPPTQKEAIQGLEFLRDRLTLAGAKEQPPEVAAVKAILEKVKAGQPLKPEDLDTLRDVVKALGEKLVAASPDTAGMQEDLKITVAASPNADRAIETYKELKRLQAQDQNNPKRLSDEVIRMLTEAVAKPRTDDVRGQAGVMGKDAALRAAKALLAMPEEDYKKTTALLQATDVHGEIRNPWADPELEKTLILKAVGAGYKPVNPGSPTAATDGERNKHFFNQLGEFARAIHDVPRDDLIRQTTLTGVEAGGASLRQRYQMSCVPTTIQMLKGEQDPVYAWTLQQEGPVQSQAAAGKTAADQKEWLEKDGGGAAIPHGVQDNYTIYNALIDARLADLVASPSEPDGADKDNNDKIQALATLRLYMEDPTFVPTEDQKKEIAAAMADLNRFTSFDKKHGIYTALESDPVWIDQAKLDAIRGEVKEHGLSTFQAGGVGMAPQDALSKRTGRNYDTTFVGDASKNVSSVFLNRAAAALEAGKAVPIRIGYVDSNNSWIGAGHALLMSDVRGAAPGREFLVSDPATGTTQWVKEEDLKNGKFANDPQYGFNLGVAKTSHMWFSKD